jgi:peptide/nickel transport system permease protein
MLKSILLRVLTALLLVVGINAAAFIATSYLEEKQQYLAGQPPIEHAIARYPEYIRTLRSGDWGTLPGATKVPVRDHLAQAFTRSMVLLLGTLVFSTVVGVSVGMASVSAKTRKSNPLALFVSLAGFSMPSFYAGIVLIYALTLASAALGFRRVPIPVAGYGLDTHMILPLVVLSLRPAAELARYTSELFSEELEKAYVATAQSKGLPPRWIMFRHVFKNVASAVAVTLGNAMRYLVSSLVVVEALFRWGGVGQSLASALAPRIDGRDPNAVLFNPPLVAALLTALALFFVVTNLVTSLIAQWIDPRLRNPEGAASASIG